MKQNYIHLGIIAIAGLFIVTPLLLTQGVTMGGQQTTELRTKQVTTKNVDDQWEPVVAHINIWVGWDIQISIETYNFDIYNWTGPDHEVRITYTIYNPYEVTNLTVWVGWRIREWQNSHIPGILFHFTNSGAISTNDTRWYKSHKLQVVPYTNSSGVFRIAVHFDNLPVYVDMTEFLWARNNNVQINFDYGSQKVHFLDMSYNQPILKDRCEGGR